MAESLLWFDYETFGLDPARDRPAQFAGLRTDPDLNALEEPFSLYCKPPPDYIPNPESCLITGITPTQAMKQGVLEHEFIRRILAAYSVPGTCGVGYNSIRFDDEVTRNCLYRNLHDPFAREWQSGNSRWDLLGVTRMARALRPDGIVWPKDKEGRPTLRLDHLTVANGIEHQDAHDAMGDVRATLGFARLLKQEQPKLFRYLWELRSKRAVLALVNPGSMTPFLMASTQMSAETQNLGMAVVVGRQPENPNALIIYDLRFSPENWMEGEPAAEGSTGPFGVLHVNRSPALAPLSVLRPQDEKRLGLDVAIHMKHLDELMRLPFRKAPGFEAFSQPFVSEGRTDADLALYAGFESDQDRKRLDAFRSPDSPTFLEMPDRFDDPRYRDLCHRYKARNFPDQLSNEELQAWGAFCEAKWLHKANGASMDLGEFTGKVSALRAMYGSDQKKMAVLDETERYVLDLTKSSSLA
jgi:exodeoxyribonuclease-1